MRPDTGQEKVKTHKTPIRLLGHKINYESRADCDLLLTDFRAAKKKIEF